MGNKDSICRAQDVDDCTPPANRSGMLSGRGEALESLIHRPLDQVVRGSATQLGMALGSEPLSSAVRRFWDTLPRTLQERVTAIAEFVEALEDQLLGRFPVLLESDELIQAGYFACQVAVVQPMYGWLDSKFKEEHRAEVMRWQKALAQVSQLSPQDLGIPQKHLQLLQTPQWERVLQSVQTVVTQQTALQKLLGLWEATELLGGLGVLGADDTMPLLEYAVIRAPGMSDLCTALMLAEQLTPQSIMTGEMGYMAVTGQVLYQSIIMRAEQPETVVRDRHRREALGRLEALQLQLSLKQKLAELTLLKQQHIAAKQGKQAALVTQEIERLRQSANPGKMAARAKRRQEAASRARAESADSGCADLEASARLEALQQQLSYKQEIAELMLLKQHHIAAKRGKQAAQIGQQIEKLQQSARN